MATVAVGSAMSGDGQPIVHPFFSKLYRNASQFEL